MVASILIFKGILEDSQAVVAVSNDLLRWGIPLMVVAMTLPMLVGLVSGITIAFVGTTFPILISLIQASPTSPAALPYLILGLVSGFDHDQARYDQMMINRVQGGFKIFIG